MFIPDNKVHIYKYILKIQVIYIHARCALKVHVERKNIYINIHTSLAVKVHVKKVKIKNKYTHYCIQSVHLTNLIVNHWTSVTDKINALIKRFDIICSKQLALQRGDKLCRILKLLLHTTIMPFRFWFLKRH